MAKYCAGLTFLFARDKGGMGQNIVEGRLIAGAHSKYIPHADSATLCARGQSVRLQTCSNRHERHSLRADIKRKAR